MAGEYTMLNKIDHDLRLKMHVEILKNLYCASMLDDAEYREELKKVEELLGFRTDQKFWTRDLY